MNLNSEQQKAVNKIDGTIMVVAGAGCGKTRVLTSRISSLIKDHKTLPQSIIALTFTNKAAKEMLERVVLELNTEKLTTKPFIGTFHSYCFFLLKRYSTIFGLENFGVLDGSDQQSIVKKILIKYGLEKEMQVRKILGYISAHKNGATPEPSSNSNESNRLLEVYQAYEKEKSLSGNLDFDDLILLVFDKLNKEPLFLETIRRGISHILIDEYQDTNALQHNLVTLLAAGKNKKQLSILSLFAVGDQDQSIYSWRGAIAENMNKFVESFDDVTLIKIEQNYRSSQQILSAANHVIKNNQRRQDKKLWSTNETPNCIFIANCKNEYQEADVVATAIKAFRQINQNSSCAILYRNHHQSRLLEEALIQNKIQYNIIGGLKFYERKEIKDLLAYLKLIVNNRDWLSLERVINCPTRSLGDKVMERITEMYSSLKYSNFLDLLTDLAPNLPQEKQRANLNLFIKIFQNIPKDQKPSLTLEQILEQTNYLGYLEKEYEPEEADGKIKNVFELQKSIKTLEETLWDRDVTVQVFLEEIALIQEATLSGENNNSKAVALMTLHGAKGLEFNFATMIGLEEGNLPSLRKNDQHSIEEERRLVYVGITRAKEKLLLCYSQNRNEYGRINNYDPSRFLEEIPEQLVTGNKQNINSNSFKNDVAAWATGRLNSSPQPSFNANTTTNQYFSPKPFSKETSKSPSIFKTNQIVTHPTFGTGVIKKIEQSNSSLILEIFFLNYGVKKINANFIKS